MLRAPSMQRAGVAKAQRELFRCSNLQCNNGGKRRAPVSCSLSTVSCSMS